MEQTVFAPLLRPLSDAPTQRDGDVHGRHVRLLRRCGGKASPRFEEQEEMVDLGIDSSSVVSSAVKPSSRCVSSNASSRA